MLECIEAGMRSEFAVVVVVFVHEFAVDIVIFVNAGYLVV